MDRPKEVASRIPVFAGRFDGGLGGAGPFPSASASSKPLRSIGLSKPRLVKVRRHLGSKAAVASDTASGLGFNPFRSAAFAASTKGSAASVNEKLTGRHPFDSQRLCGIDGGFLFSAGCKEKPSTKRGNGGGSSHPGGAHLGRSQPIQFEGGINAAKDSGLGYNGAIRGSAMNSTGPNMEYAWLAKFSNANFVFGTNSSKSLDGENLVHGSTIGGKTSDLNGFVYGSTVEGSSRIGQNLRKNSEATKVGSSGLRKAKTAVLGAGCAHDSDKNGTGLHAADPGSSIKSREGSDSADTSASVFGYSQEKSFSCWKTSRSSGSSNLGSSRPVKFDTAPFVSCAGSASNMHAKDVGLGSTKHNGYGFGSDRNRESNDYDVGLSTFACSAKKGSILNRNSSVGSDKGSISVLSDEMKKLHTESSSNNDDFEKKNQTDQRTKAGTSSIFIFGASTNASSSCDGINVELEEIQKLNITSVTAPQNTNKESLNHPPGVFVFGGNEKTNIAGNSDPVDSSAVNSGTSAKFTFHAEKRMGSSNDAFLQTKEYDTCPMATPLRPSSHNTFDVTRIHQGTDIMQKEFTTIKQETSCLSKESLSSTQHLEMAFRDRNAQSKSTRTMKRTSKLKQSATIRHCVLESIVTGQEGYAETVELQSPGGHSPMDCSPYPEDLPGKQNSRESSMASDESIYFSCASNEEQKSNSVKENLISASEHLVVDEDTPEPRQTSNADDIVNIGSNSDSKSSDIDKEAHLPPRESFSFKSEDISINNDARSASMEDEIFCFVSNIRSEASEWGGCFSFASDTAHCGGSNVIFASSPSTQGPLSAPKRRYRRKSRMSSSQAPPDPNIQALEGVHFVPRSVNSDRVETKRIPESSKETIVADALSVAMHEECDNWRIRGNQAYANGQFDEAEEYYTHGLNSFSSKETSRCCNRAMMLCYCNRAATRMSRGRMREALRDCMMAAEIDPSFLKARVRAANCQLALGEVEDALKHYMECLQSNKADLGQKILTEASDGLQKAKKVADYMLQSAELLQKRTSSEVTRALKMISSALSISRHSDSLMEMKAEALLMLRRYEEVIQFCEWTRDLAEKNSVLYSAGAWSKNVGHYESVKCSPRLWRLCLISKSYFYLGKLEEALELLKKHEEMKYLGKLEKKHKETQPVVGCGNSSVEYLLSLFDTIRELLRLKAAGNEAFQAGKYSEAVEHYTAALACNSESRPFSAICFCNRAAAHQALGQITDAIADCSLAIAIDATYPKAISRRATLNEMIRDYRQAANDLCRLVSLLEKGLKVNGKLTSNNPNIEQARMRLAAVENEAKKETSLNMYLILGTEPSSSAADVKKAYHKAALRHHPDKACQFLVINGNVNDGCWKEIAEAVHMDADHLFKGIGEAFNTLSDPGKRMQYDMKEEMGKSLKKGCNGETPKSSKDYYSGQYGRSSTRHQWRQNRSPYQQHWSEYAC